MDSLLNAAARALAGGDPLRALQGVALRNDAGALALRGIAMAQLGELARARQLLRRAARAFGPSETVARARCVLAEAEVALAARELGRSADALAEVERTLRAHGDHLNALHACLLSARTALLLGQVDRAERTLAGCVLDRAPARLVAVFELIAAELALRRSRAHDARAALERAGRVAQRAGVAALEQEIAHAAHGLTLPVARLLAAGRDELLRLEQVEDVLAAPGLIVDARNRSVRTGPRVVALARRPVLFALARVLAAAWPADVARDTLIGEVFAARRANDSHRARLRVEIGRLRKQLAPISELRATPSGFVLAPRKSLPVVLLAVPFEGQDLALLALLADGAAWSTSALALALGSGQRTVQRALGELEVAGRVRSIGRARAQRWLALPLSGFTTRLLLPHALASG